VQSHAFEIESCSVQLWERYVSGLSWNLADSEFMLPNDVLFLPQEYVVSSGAALYLADLLIDGQAAVFLRLGSFCASNVRLLHPVVS
jgi:hypothetical protein